MGLRGPGARAKPKAADRGEKATKRRLPWEKRGLTRPERVIAFCEWLPITKGILAGKKMKLLEGQKAFIQDVYGNLDENDRRRTRLAIKSEPRGNGKTGLVTALLLCHLLGPESEPRGEIYSAAIDKMQASLLFNEMQAIVQAVPEFDERVNCQRFHKRLEVLDGPGTGSIYEALSADVRRAHGLATSVFCYDEYAQAKTAELMDNLVTSLGKRNESLGLVISTQAATDQHPLSLMIDDAMKGEDPSVVCHLTAAPEDSDPFDPEVWKACNPALGVFLNHDEFASQAARAARVPSFLPRFLNLRLNMRIEAEARFMAATDWKACSTDFHHDELLGQKCFLGLDLSSTTDLTSLAAYFPQTGHVLSWSWVPQEGLTEAERRDRVPYDTWERLGHLETTHGRVIDKAFVVARLAQIAADYDVQACAYDRWRIEDLKKIMLDEGVKLEMTPWGQGWKDMGPAIDAFETIVLNRTLKHPGSPVLDWAVANAVAVADPTGARKLVKPKSIGRIDPLVALVMAVGIASRTAPKKQSVYATRGVFSVGASAT